jgi:hypothetical protein
MTQELGKDWPEDFWWVDTRSGIYAVDEDTADTLWDAMRQDSPSHLTFRAITGTEWRGPLRSILELSHVTPENVRGQIAFNVRNEHSREAVEKEARGHYFDWEE